MILYMLIKTIAGIPSIINAAKSPVILLSLHLGNSSIGKVYHINLEIK